MVCKQAPPPDIQPREFRSEGEIDQAILKLQRRVKELEQLDVQSAVFQESGEGKVAIDNVRTTILAVFGPNSPEFKEHEHIMLWAGDMYVDMPDHQILQGKMKGRAYVVTVLNGLISRLKENREDLAGGQDARPSGYFDKLKLHPRIADVARDLFMDDHHFDAVFAASKALVNFVKERSDRHDLDGAPLMREVFSRKVPILTFNDLSDKTDEDEQEGLMHLFEGAALAIRNPGGHAFPEGSEQRALEYISFLSMLAYLVQESKKSRPSS
jgi:uncharacterized protein (TIGR02391 family)